MDYTAIYPYPDKDFETTCPFCGCRYRVQTQLQDGHNEREEYYCPECGKEEGIRTCLSPTVTLISGRTDNRTCKYSGES